MIIKTLRQELFAEFQAVNQTIIEALHSKVPQIEKIGHYLVNSGGKRMRPMLHLLTAKACNAPDDKMIPLAAIIEFIHTATLLHDDVVDESSLRRGKATANAVWDNATAVLVGDFIYSRAFQMMVKLENPSVMQILADTTNTIAEGEVLQLQNKGSTTLSEDDYFKIIECKTAKLFESACELGAVISQCETHYQTAYAHFGRCLGMAFQIMDDVLDYSASAQELGKNIGDDLREGKVTLPLLHALNHLPWLKARKIKKMISAPQSIDHKAILKALEETKAIDYAKHVATEYADRAIHELSQLPDSPYHLMLNQLADFAVNRTH